MSRLRRELHVREEQISQRLKEMSLHLRREGDANSFNQDVRSGLYEEVEGLKRELQGLRAAPADASIKAVEDAMRTMKESIFKLGEAQKDQLESWQKKVQSLIEERRNDEMRQEEVQRHLQELQRQRDQNGAFFDAKFRDLFGAVGDMGLAVRELQTHPLVNSHEQLRRAVDQSLRIKTHLERSDDRLFHLGQEVEKLERKMQSQPEQLMSNVNKLSDRISTWAGHNLGFLRNEAARLQDELGRARRLKELYDAKQTDQIYGDLMQAADGLASVASNINLRLQLGPRGDVETFLEQKARI